MSPMLQAPLEPAMRRRRWLAVAIFAVIILTIGIYNDASSRKGGRTFDNLWPDDDGGNATQNGPQPTVAIGTWRDYFVPARVGRSCALGQHDNTGPTDAPDALDWPIFAGSLQVTQRVGRVDVVDDETTIDVHVTASADAMGLGLVALPHEQDLRYVLHADGTLSAPAVPATTGLVSTHSDGIVTYPLVNDLGAGQGTQAEVELIVDLDDEDRAELQVAQLVLHGTVDVRGTGPATIVTPAGTYPDVVGIRVSVRDLLPTNVTPQHEPAARIVATYVETTLPATTTWYARGVGPVRIRVELLMLTAQADLLSCTG
jgi:hypothetical protein